MLSSMLDCCIESCHQLQVSVKPMIALDIPHSSHFAIEPLHHIMFPHYAFATAARPAGWL